MSKSKSFLASLSAFLLTLIASPAFADYALNFPEPVSPLTSQMYDLHMLTTKIATIIMVIVISIVTYAILKFRKSKGAEADQNFHKSAFGTWSWILVPIIVLGIDLTIAGSATDALKQVEDYSQKNDVTVKVIGSQWKWTYEYMDDDIRVVSNMLSKEEAGDNYLRAVDNPLVLPVNKRIRFLHTASDVLHAWWVPQIVYKKDSIPGYINETWTIIEKEGTYRGQCAEICGTGHAFMPIVVEAVSQDKYDAWLSEKKIAMASAAAEASADKTWTMAELMSRGEQVYNTNCVACHQITGEGVPGVFPALKGGQIATGPVADHLSIVMNGSTKNPVMAAWAGALNDLELAALITYERNAWGNNTGDVVQPTDIKSARK
ncbi:MAG: cytochrome c oxidase subunit II [Gammaproteobacteria bacterium]|nr:cytochrome c oxidase subunit II [Gammaproteobacteria bacterium]MDH5736087.1 cytochrome c oxidase subunit II [Gammaproteobacteria bacterium]